MSNILLVFLALLASVTANPAVTIQKGNITYLGSYLEEYGVESFQNIRFGDNTGGANRFRRPQPFIPDPNMIFDSSMPGAACPQQSPPIKGLPWFSNVTKISEDCLTLRISRPARRPEGEKLPVLVWIYGGGDSIGQIYDSLYDPSHMVANAAAAGRPFIYAAMNYRVGVFGFAATSTLAQEGNLNAALLDQRMGLEWIKDHIERFGGDPDNISIFGESDGATNVGLQVTAYGGNGSAPFRRAIMESGSPAADPGVASDFGFKHTALFLQLLNCTSQNDAENLECARNLSMETLLRTGVSTEFDVIPANGFEVFLPTVDGDFIPEPPSKLVRDGRFYRNVSTIIGWNQDDGTIFVSPDVNSEADVVQYLKNAFPGLQNDTITAILDHYPLSEFTGDYSRSSQYYRLAQLWRDAEFVCPSVMFAYQVFKQGSRSYLFDLNQTLFSRFDDTVLPDKDFRKFHNI